MRPPPSWLRLSVSCGPWLRRRTMTPIRGISTPRRRENRHPTPLSKGERRYRPGPRAARQQGKRSAKSSPPAWQARGGRPVLGGAILPGPIRRLLARRNPHAAQALKRDPHRLLHPTKSGLRSPRRTSRYTPRSPSRTPRLPLPPGRSTPQVSPQDPFQARPRRRRLFRLPNSPSATRIGNQGRGRPANRNENPPMSRTVRSRFGLPPRRWRFPTAPLQRTRRRRRQAGPLERRSAPGIFNCGRRLASNGIRNPLRSLASWLVPTQPRRNSVPPLNGPPPRGCNPGRRQPANRTAKPVADRLPGSRSNAAQRRSPFTNRLLRRAQCRRCRPVKRTVGSRGIETNHSNPLLPRRPSAPRRVHRAPRRRNICPLRRTAPWLPRDCLQRPVNPPRGPRPAGAKNSNRVLGLLPARARYQQPIPRYGTVLTREQPNRFISPQAGSCQAVNHTENRPWIPTGVRRHPSGHPAVLCRRPVRRLPRHKIALTAGLRRFRARPENWN